VDWNEILRTIPENEVAWHAGGTANSLYLSIEMCEPYWQDTAKFTEVWNRTVWLAADICIRYGWLGSQNIWSHQDTSQLYGQTDHTDPISYLGQYGKSWAELESAIDSKITEMKSGTGGSTMINNLILYAYDADSRAAAYLGDHLNAPIIRLDNVLKEDLDSAKNIYVVGGSKKPVERAILLTGYTKFDTCRRVLDFIDTGK
jgi:N-acetylmuramoyl-L-alanine amidase